MNHILTLISLVPRDDLTTPEERPPVVEVEEQGLHPDRVEVTEDQGEVITRIEVMYNPTFVFTTDRLRTTPSSADFLAILGNITVINQKFNTSMHSPDDSPDAADAPQQQGN